MAFSNTVSTTVFNTGKVISSAFRRCRVPAEQLTAEPLIIAQEQLYLFLSDLANQGVQLWCIEKQLYPLYDGLAKVTLDLGTVEILNSYFRTTQEATGTDTDTSTTHTTEFTSDTLVSTVGILWAGASSPIAIERSDDGVTWTTIQNETPSVTIGQITWYDLATEIAASWFRVRATSGTLLFDTVYWGLQPTRITLARLNRDDFTNLPNPTFTSNRVLQYWFDRQVNQPVMRLWPVPTGTAVTQSQIEVWRQRYIMDVGTLTQELEFPQRWYEAVVSGLARKLARELIQVDPAVIPQLDADAAAALMIAQTEETDASPTRWAPNISPYTA